MNIIPFKRGQTFSIIVDVPTTYVDGALIGWTVTSHLRKINDDSPTGLIAVLDSYWEDPDTTRQVHLYHNITNEWPLCVAELDVKFTSPGGEKLYSETLTFRIIRSIT